MTSEEYKEVQGQMVDMAAQILDLPLVEFIGMIDRAEALGPILDPTLYIRGSRQMAQVRELAIAFRGVQGTFESHIAQNNLLQGEGG